ncbi:hypothetical protein EXIGLDRAFT_765699 [Exidia glandulosa HHB12029]|uniref:DUF6699 domain-containing protein n=1 Tax=Exidia glandulosa HHB12029 TaxID=1314781 RepID=A0A165K9M6_EXIGL|nr:hypothetical protein EXIGLDRAFT_765699 [Exidia glandulosa HHB12029]
MSSPQYTHAPGAPRMGTMPLPPLTPQTTQYRVPYATPPTSPYAGSTAHMSPAPATPQSTRSSPYQPLTPISPARSQLPGSVAPSQYFAHCVWDVTQSPNQACTPQRQPFTPYLPHPGTDSPVPQVTLYLHLGLPAPQAVVVNAADRRAVTINDILAHIYATLHSAMGPALWNNLPLPKQQRVAASTGHQQPRMLHLLEGATRLASVRPSQAPNSFDILFSR